MAPKNPPLHLVRVFEAAGNQLSFKKAAELLHVTPSAISHQIRALEDHLGFKLFRRLNRALELTEGGEVYLQVVNRSMRHLREGTEEVLNRFGHPVLRCSMLQYFANRFVIPQLHGFQQQFPDVELRLETALSWSDFDLNSTDIAIRLGMESTSKLDCIELDEATVTPLCAPTLLQGKTSLALAQITELPLIHATQLPDAWPRWFSMVGLDYQAKASDIWFDNYPAMLQAAQQGLGVAMGMLPMVASLLAEGSLVEPFNKRIALGDRFCIVYRRQLRDRPDLIAFRDWLVELFQQIRDSSEYHSAETG